jgi:hypothetical protein
VYLCVRVADAGIPTLPLLRERINILLFCMVFTPCLYVCTGNGGRSPVGTLGYIMQNPFALPAAPRQHRRGRTRFQKENNPTLNHNLRTVFFSGVHAGTFAGNDIGTLEGKRAVQVRLTTFCNGLYWDDSRCT